MCGRRASSALVYAACLTRYIILLRPAKMHLLTLFSSTQSMALDSFQLLARQSESTEGDLQVKVLQTLFDLIVLHGVNFGEERGFGVSQTLVPRNPATKADVVLRSPT